MGDDVSYEEPGRNFYRLPSVDPEAVRIIGEPILDALNRRFSKCENEQPPTTPNSNPVGSLLREGSPAGRLYRGSDSR